MVAEAVRFELTEVLPSLVFKTSALNHSATLPHKPEGVLEEFLVPVRRPTFAL